MLEDADKMENSLAKLASSYFDFCACLYLELLCFIFLYMQREETHPKGVHSLPRSGRTAGQSQLALERTTWGTLPRRTGSTVFWFKEMPGRRNLHECFQRQVTFLPPPIYLWPARARLQHSTAEKERILLLKSIKQSQTNDSFPSLPRCAQVTNSG